MGVRYVLSAVAPAAQVGWVSPHASGWLVIPPCLRLADYLSMPQVGWLSPHASGWLVISPGGASASDLAAALGHASLVAYLTSRGSERGHSPHSSHTPHSRHTPHSPHIPHTPPTPHSTHSANGPHSRLVAPAAAADVELVEIGGLPAGAATLG